MNGFVNDQDTLLICGLGFGTLTALFDPDNGYCTQLDANTVRFDFGNGDIFTINSASNFTIADLVDDIMIGLGCCGLTLSRK